MYFNTPKPIVNLPSPPSFQETLKFFDYVVGNKVIYVTNNNSKKILLLQKRWQTPEEENLLKKTGDLFRDFVREFSRSCRWENVKELFVYKPIIQRLAMLSQKRSEDLKILVKVENFSDYIDYLNNAFNKNEKQTFALIDFDYFNFKRALNKINNIFQERRYYIQQKLNVSKPTIFISYAHENDIKSWLESNLSKDLESIGFNVQYDLKNLMVGTDISDFENKFISDSTYILVLCTPKYLERENLEGTGVNREVKLIYKQLEFLNKKSRIIPLFRKGSSRDCIPKKLSNKSGLDFNKDSYYRNFFSLCQSLLLYEENNASPIEEIKQDFLKNFHAMNNFAAS